MAGIGAAVLAGCRKRDRVRVGSKNFSESVLLGEIVAQHLAARAGVEIDRRFNLGGTFVCHQGLLSGDLDLYVEYTGTALVAILKDERSPPLTDPARVRAAVESTYRDKLGLVWSPPFGFDDTFAILVRRADAERLGLKNVSDLARAEASPRPGFGYEFVARKDGYDAFVTAYGLRFTTRPATMELDLTYRALADGKVDVVAGNSTDGRIDKLGLVQLVDDRRFFPPYEAAPVVRKATIERYPSMLPALAALGGKISTATMRRMNYAVDAEGKSAEEVARGFLAGLG